MVGELWKLNIVIILKTNCDTTGLVLPIWEYGHNEMGGFSITGGFVYNGKSAPGLSNKYVYADYVHGRIWTFGICK